ncbi:MAG TPA: M48 family metalloprotease [Longimicrobiaceae bacterium]|nr:M48 family metalloprotease [Longimicrobiaceae bacterium]
MPFDFEVEDGLNFGDWLHREIHANALVESHGWAAEQVRRVSARLQAGRPESERLIVEVPWLREANAFTAPGRYVYFSRRLLERCPREEAVAFVIAHEIAHHDLGHLDLFSGWAGRLSRLAGARLMALPFQALERRLYGSERECAADRHGLALCIAAGYHPMRCLGLYDVLEHFALDAKDFEMVYGLDPESDEELSGEAPWTTRARIWAWQRSRGYLPIQDRKAALVRWLEANAGFRGSPAG